MRFQLLLPSLAATALAQVVYKPAPGGIMPGCADTVPGTFELVRVAPGGIKKRDNIYPYEGQPVALSKLTLKNGILKDREGRIGSIVANFQFQFDGPPQDIALITKGFSLCKNHTIALGRSTTFEECDAGAKFWNYYFFEGLDTSQGRPSVCRGVNFVAPPAGGLGAATTVNSVVEVTEIATAGGYGATSGTGAYGAATGTGATKGTGKDATATGRGTAAATAGASETGLPTGKDAKDSKDSKDAKGTSPGIGSNSTASLTALTPNISTTSASNSTTTTTSEPKPPPASAPTSAPKAANSAGSVAAAQGHSVALLAGLLGVALL